MITTPESVKAEDESAKQFYANTAFEQTGEQLDAMKESQKEIEANDAEENSDD